jgi:hypothetical protein
MRTPLPACKRLEQRAQLAEALHGEEDITARVPTAIGAVHVRPEAGQFQTQLIRRANDDMPLVLRQDLQFLSVQGMMASGHSYTCRGIFADILSL